MSHERETKRGFGETIYVVMTKLGERRIYVQNEKTPSVTEV